MKNTFRKRVFTPETLAKSIAAIAKDLPRLPKLLYPDAISPAFREKLFLAVTSVNKCRYCTWMHTEIAGNNGVDAAQVAALLESSVDADFGDEKEALVYAVHFAETERNPTKTRTGRLIAKYGEERAAQIVQYLNLIYFANLSGNTFDAFLSRVEGNAPEQGNMVFEAAFSALAAPALLAVRAVYGKNEVAA